MKRITAVLASLGLLLLTACASQEPVPEDRYYRLPVSSSTHKLKTPLKPVPVPVLIVGPLQARGIYNERAILYIRDEQPLEVMRYHYHYWLQAPTELVQENLLAYLRSTGLSENTVPYGMRVQSKYQLAGRILRFERLIGNKGIRVLARIEFVLEKNGHPVFSQVYEQSLAADGPGMHATARAMGQALEKIYRQLEIELQTRLR